MWMKMMIGISVWLGILQGIQPLWSAQPEPIVLGLNADMSSGSAEAGKSIQQGILIAVEQVNLQGGVLGRPLELKTLNHRGNPARGKANIRKLVEQDNVVAILGGLHTPVMLAEKKALFDTKKAAIPYLAPWAAGTPIVDNPWIFRLSVRDEDVGPFLIEKAQMRGFKKVALLLENTAWGRSNEISMKRAIAQQGLALVDLQWFPWLVKTRGKMSSSESQWSIRLAQKLEMMYQSGAEVVLLVANAPEGAEIVKQVLIRTEERRLPIISHWGITGGGFPQRVGHDLTKVDLSFLQTYSFLNPSPSKLQHKVLALAKQLFAPQVQTAKDIVSPVGLAHAFDLVHLLVKAIEQAQSTDRNKVRLALEKLPRHVGLVRTYDPAFSEGHGRAHEALNRNDFHLAQFVFDDLRQNWLIRVEGE